MAIKDQVLKNAGGLYKTSEEELSKLTKKSGRLQAPVNPMETKAIGGNVDQAKMAGSPNQKMNALRTAVSQDVNLGDVQRRKSPEASAAQQGQKAAMEAKLAELEGLGDLSARVRQIALSRFERDYTAPTALTVNEFTNTPEWDAVPQTAKDALARGEVSDVELQQIAEGLGITDVAQIGELASAIKNQLGVEVDSQSEFLSNLAAGQIKLGELTPDDLTELGYTDKAAMAASLDITEEELDGLSLDALEDRIDSQQSELFDQARELRNVLSDPTSTAAARAAARSELRQLQQAGIDDAEVQFNNLERSIKDGRTIEFDGERVSVEELLSSEGLELRIAQALSSEEEMARLKDSEPELHEFIVENKAAFDGLVDEIDEDTKRFIELQESNEALAKPSEDVEAIPEDVMSTWYEDWGTVRGEAYKPNGVLQLMQDPELDLSVKQGLRNVVDALNIAPGGKDDLAYLGTLTPQQLEAAGLTNPSHVQKYLKYREDYDRLKDLEGNDFLSGSIGLDADSLQTYLSKATAMNASGFKKVSNPMLYAVLDKNGDGKLDDLGEIKKRILGSGATLEQLVKNNKSVGSVADVPRTKKFADSLKTSTEGYSNPVFDKVKDYFKDGNLSRSEAKEMSSKLSKEDLYELYKRNPKAIGKDAKGAIRMKLESHAVNRANEHFDFHMNEDTAPPLPKGPYGLADINIKSPVDIIRAKDSIRKEIKRIESGAAGGNPRQRAAWKSEHRMKLELLNRMVSHLVSKTKDNANYGTPFDIQRILEVKNKLKNS